MKISIHGLGYVGCVSLGCLAELGHQVIGVDIDPAKVALVNSGKGTIVEKGIDPLIRRNRRKGRISATDRTREAVEASDVAVICVGTPNDRNGHLDMGQIHALAKQIGQGLGRKRTFYTIALRSTVMPGTNARVTDIIASESGKRPHLDFGVVSNPEFLREGTAVADYFHPPYTILASLSNQGIRTMRALYRKIEAEVVVTDVGSAELIKFVNNSYHALKVVFANEMGRLCKSLGIDGRILMELFAKDTVLNISPYYFRPGFAYGGSCLPKDLRALNAIGHDQYLTLPVLSAVEASNRSHVDHALQLILKKDKRHIGFFGISFKAGTDDLRFSPALDLAEQLIGKGYDVRIFDRNVQLSRLSGKNKQFLFEKLPHINRLLFEDFDKFRAGLDILVLVNRDDRFRSALSSLPGGTELIDLTGFFTSRPHAVPYEGICW